VLSGILDLLWPALGAGKPAHGPTGGLIAAASPVALRRRIHSLGSLEQAVAERTFCGELGGRLGGENPFPSGWSPPSMHATYRGGETREHPNPVLDRACGPFRGFVIRAGTERERVHGWIRAGALRT
jgi:hypothetical protein